MKNMEAFKEVIIELLNIWKSIFSSIFAAIPKIISFILWLMVGIIVLPCVFIAGTIFPWWNDWGDDF